MSRGDHYKTAWPSKAKKVERSWGHELSIGSLGTTTMKALHIKENNSTSLKWYRKKNEVLFVRTGHIVIEYDSEKYHWQEYTDRNFKKAVLLSGDVFFVQSNCPYKITAIEDSEIFEIGDCSNDAPIKIEESEET